MNGSTIYQLVLPTPWEHIPVGAGRDERIEQIVAAAIARQPSTAPPDQVAQGRIRMTEMLRRQLRECEPNGGLDYYLPTDVIHGVQLNSSFIVSEVIPDASAPEGLTGKILASLASQERGGRPVTAGDTVWVRMDEVTARPADQTISEDVGARRIDYMTALPSDERRWIIVSFTTFGDGDPRSEFSDLMVELFDAIMSTWRWLEAPAPAPASGPASVPAPVSADGVHG